MIVVDAPVLANVVGDDGPDGERARAELRSAGEIAAPDLVDVETVSVLRKRWLAKTLSARRFASAVEDLDVLAIDRFPTLRFMRRAYELRDDMTAYDTTYIALAEVLRCELVTSDRRLARAPGARCPIRVLA